MLKLYKRADEGLYYWETWDKDSKTAIVHWGKVGERGAQRGVASGIFSNFRKTIQKEINERLTDGYQSIDIDKHHTLLIEYKIDDMGTPADLEKRSRLEQRMDETLGWTGLGHCDGGSYGHGSMEVCCFVVDFDIASQIIQADLKGTEFADYTRIFDENEG